MKKGQLSTVLIVGVVLLAGFLLLLFSSESFNENVTEITQRIASEISFQNNPIGAFVQDCLDQQVHEGIVLMGIQGGEVYLEEDNFVTTSFSQVRHGYFEEENHLPSTQDMERQLLVFLESNLDTCLRGFSDFVDEDIQLAETSFYVNILDQEVTVDAKIPLTITKDEAETTLEDFSTRAIVPLGRAHSLAMEIIEAANRDPEWVDVSSLYNRGFNIDVLTEKGDTLLYSMVPQSPSSEYSDFVFVTAVVLPSNDAPVITLQQESFDLLVGEPFELQIPVEDDGEVTFEDDAFFFDISSDGRIEFSPTFPGVFNARIIVTDEIGQRTVKKLTFNVNEEVAISE